MSFQTYFKQHKSTIMKILNCYAGIGGNRKLWDKPLQEKFGNNYKITAIELNPEIAAIYKDFYPDDEVIVCDAHEYLLAHFKEFDFIWCSPPCPTHSKMVKATKKDSRKIKYPDMKLYQEIILLKNLFNGQFVIENVVPYYDYLINPDIVIDRHPFWTNFKINKIQVDKPKNFITAKKTDLEKFLGFPKLPNIYTERCHDPSRILRNCVNPKLGLHFLNRALKIKESKNIKEQTLF